MRPPWLGMGSGQRQRSWDSRYAGGEPHLVPPRHPGAGPRATPLIEGGRACSRTLGAGRVLVDSGLPAERPKCVRPPLGLGRPEVR